MHMTESADSPDENVAALGNFIDVLLERVLAVGLGNCNTST
jgi:hypothetical protein